MGQAAARFDYGFSGEGGATGERVQERSLGWGAGEGRGVQPLAVSIFADRGYLRAEMAEDAAAAGLRVAQTSDLERLVSDAAAPGLGDVVLVDCPVIDGLELAALSRLDIRAAQSGSQLVVSTSIGSLDDVYDSASSALPGGAQRGSRFSAKASVPSRSSG